MGLRGWCNRTDFACYSRICRAFIHVPTGWEKDCRLIHAFRPPCCNAGERGCWSLDDRQRSVARREGVLVCIVLIALNALIGFLTARSNTVEKILDGEAVLLGRDGSIFESVRKEHRLSKGDIERALREADCEQTDLRYAFLETDGSVTIQKAPNK